ncbi:hypothetical protein FHW36_1115 [Chitinophaga polysaccharea]|uniref:Uncharacterized protein n=1 Tax=Chitinophaga polysaccharea TaxID=1293035 RepID=A0A561P6T7_9BACT|nr:hypothetical protein FHW36_1115 [Chitinophaga polysaccharea]
MTKQANKCDTMAVFYSGVTFETSDSQQMF